MVFFHLRLLSSCISLYDTYFYYGKKFVYIIPEHRHLDSFKSKYSLVHIDHTMGVRIKIACKEDLDEITTLWYELAVMHEEMMEGYDLNDDPCEEWRNLMEKSLKRDDMTTFAAWEQGQILGFASVMLRNRAPFFKEKEMGVIMDVFIRDDRRGEGIGSKLVTMAERWIKNKGIDLAIVTVAPENQGAVRFWSKHGYDTYLLRQRKEL